MMRRCLWIGGEGWRLTLPGPDLLNERKFAAYLGETEGPEIVVSSDDQLLGEAYRHPVVEASGGRLEFEAQEARWWSEPDLDRVKATVAAQELPLERALTAWICSKVVRDGGLMMHAAAVRSEKGALLLLGRSGAGKSTASRLAGDRSLCTNAVILKKRPEGWVVYTTPFTGKNDPYPIEAGPFPLAGAMVLEKSPHPALSQGERVGPRAGLSQGLAALGQAVVAQYPHTADYSLKMLCALESLAASCPVARLPFRIDSIDLPD